MKKCILIASFMLCSLASFAYYDDSSTSGLTAFVSILLVIFGILNIILFFKLWGATNNINAIAHKITDNPTETSYDILLQQIFLLKSKGEIDKAIQLLNDRVEDKISYYMYKKLDDYYTNEFIEKHINDIINTHLPYYKVLGAELPEYFNQLKSSNYQNFLKSVQEKRQEK